MSKKRFFEIDYDEIYYIVDSSRLQRRKATFEDEYEYQEYCLENSLIGTQVVDLLNSLTEENEKLKEQVQILKKEVRDFLHLCDVCDIQSHLSDECEEVLNDE